MGWKVVSKVHGRPPRTRYVAPNGKAFHSIREFCELLMEQEGAKTEVIANKQCINNEGATDAQKFGKWGFRKPRNKSSKSRNNSSYNLHIGLLNKSSPVLDYYNSLYGKAGRRKDNVTQKVLNSRKNKAISYLKNKGWKTKTMKKSLKEGECKVVKWYVSPDDYWFGSLRTACKHWIEE
ncbi:hypothetical protein QJS04_geneDACA010601 [Acorus gramineus]|uniref:DUF7028 domain-containing protein n=1 Tax=Acorus gramineus TaxID=55184 RepID=A0AAV9AJY5_ACOGR|nr:hypothetical protein QJS04_geneDACA010601 [Acorus gramineus]